MKEAIIIFTRVPIPGKTKTRLEKFITKEECAELHKNFLKDIKSTIEHLNRDIFVFYTQEDKNNILYNIFGEKVNYQIQEGHDLGEKMYNAIEFVLKNRYDSCILMGTDIPYLEEKDVENAFNILKNKDIVLGPTQDEGYYLVGMKKPTKKLFENIEYGHGNVLDNTIASIIKNNLTYGLTKINRDIDEEEDIRYFYEEIKNGLIDENMNTSKFIINKLEECR